MTTTQLRESLMQSDGFSSHTLAQQPLSFGGIRELDIHALARIVVPSIPESTSTHVVRERFLQLRTRNIVETGLLPTRDGPTLRISTERALQVGTYLVVDDDSSVVANVSVTHHAGSPVANYDPIRFRQYNPLGYRVVAEMSSIQYAPYALVHYMAISRHLRVGRYRLVRQSVAIPPEFCWIHVDEEPRQ